jgi:hypothetical protein
VGSFELKSRQTEEMDNGAVNAFETACGKEFFPLYLPLVHKATYQDLQCSVHRQTVLHKSDSRNLPEESFIKVSTGNVDIVMKISARSIIPPPQDFDEVVKQTLEMFSAEFQQILSDRTPYFESVQDSAVSEAQQPSQSSYRDEHKSQLVIVVSVCGGIVAMVALAMLVRKGHKSRGTSPEALATLVDDGVAVEVFSVGTHRKSLVVEDCESHSSLSSTSTGPQPDSIKRNPYSQRPDTQTIVSPTPYQTSPRIDSTARLVDGTSIITTDAVPLRVPFDAIRMASFSTGVCSKESDLFGRSYKDGIESSEGDSRLLDLVESSTTGSRVSMGYDDCTPILQSPVKLQEEGKPRFTWTHKILRFGFGAGTQERQIQIHKSTAFARVEPQPIPSILEVRSSETKDEGDTRLTSDSQIGDDECGNVDLDRAKITETSISNTSELLEDLHRVEEQRKETVESEAATAPSPRVRLPPRSTGTVVEKYRDYTMATQRQRSTAELLSADKRSSSSLTKTGMFKI